MNKYILSILVISLTVLSVQSSNPIGLNHVHLNLNPFTDKNMHVENAINLDDFVGIYEYVYPGNTQRLIENHFLVFIKTNNNLTGWYYGTSDEFDKAREGYLPGFFVSQMDKLQINGDTIRFVLHTNNSDFLTQSVDLKLRSTNEAINSGYKCWRNKIPTTPKTYIGWIKNSETIIFKGEKEFMDKTFKKKE